MEDQTLRVLDIQEERKVPKNSFALDFGALSEKVHKAGLWVIILLLIGASFGVWGSRAYYDHKVSEAVTLKRFLYQNGVYEIRQIELDPTVATHK